MTTSGRQAATGSTSDRSAGSVLQRTLQVAMWVVAALGAAGGYFVQTPGHTELLKTGVVIAIGCFFPILVARLIVAAVRHRARRASLLVFAGGIAAWAAGSALLQTHGALTLLSLLTPAELCFFASYVGFAAFLILDAPWRRLGALTVWLETTVICAGTASVAGLVLLTPAALAFGGKGLPLLVSLIWPLFDLVLAVVVIGQVSGGRRRPDLRTIGLVVSILALAVADASYVSNLGSTTYVGSGLIDVTYGLAFGLMVEAACARRHLPEPTLTPPRRTRPLVAAASTAVLVLALHPGSTIAWYVVPPAVLTLAAAGARLALALREAQGAAEARQLSRTDELTGLGNRRAVLAEIDEGLGSDRPLALILLDLDGFKEINDSLGHAAGDAVLQTVAARLDESAGLGGPVGRLGGDEFALVLREEDPAQLARVAASLRETLLRPLQVDNLHLTIRASMGIAVREPADVRATDLLRRADVAMYEAKNTRGGAVLYDAAHDGFTRQRLQLAEELREGIGAGELVVWYQPQIDARTGRVVAAEALVRWQHPQDGLLMPIHFLPDARRSGLMLALTHSVMRTVVADSRRWAAEGLDLRVSLNCAPPELLGGALLPQLFEAIDEAGLAPDSLIIEVTEDSFLSDPEHARQTLLQLRERRVQTAIDDYGTGFSSLAYLRDLPVHELKMDRSFVSTIRTDPRSRVIVDSTNQMAHAMGMRLVAEGVEDAETAAELTSIGIDVLQGYHFSRPMPAAELSGWVRRWSAAPAAAHQLIVR